MPDEKKPEAPAQPQDQPAWEGSLSDGNFMPAPDGHDVTKDALAEKKGK